VSEVVGLEGQFEEAMNAGVAESLSPGNEVLGVSGIYKRFGGVEALHGADLTVPRGEVHAILGENGAGKSTLVKIIAGVFRPDDGEIRIDGQAFRAMSPQGVRELGISVVYQELSLVQQLSVAHNLVLTRLPRRAGLVSLRKAYAIAEEALEGLALGYIDPRAPVASLPLDQQQMLEIVKATMTRPKILVLDEATSSLGGAEVGRLFDLVRALRDEGTTVVVITHRMHEVWELADAMTILRDGATIGRYDVNQISQHEAVNLMAGQDVRAIFPQKHPAPANTVALELSQVRLRPGQEPWALDFRRGEILGLGGLEGQGQREFLSWIYGIGPGSGAVKRGDTQLKIRGPADALAQGIVLIPEDRKVEGLHLDLPVRWNLAMATLGERSTLGVIHMRTEREFAHDAIEQMAIKVGSPFQPASALSGGTQQKVVLGKFMARNPSVILFVDAMRGIDVQTKFGFYGMLRELARSGATCVLYSSDTEELVGLCDRIAVFSDGAPVRVLEESEITLDAVVAASFAVGG
jgi:ribose transport system ATP-binding protein